MPCNDAVFHAPQVARPAPQVELYSERDRCGTCGPRATMAPVILYSSPIFATLPSCHWRVFRVRVHYVRDIYAELTRLLACFLPKNKDSWVFIRSVMKPACGAVSRSCAQDCAGVWGGASTLDRCGICGGDGSKCLDCAGVPYGANHRDLCGTCNDDNADDCYPREGSSKCTGCSIGQYAATVGQTVCTNCGLGTSLGETCTLRGFALHKPWCCLV